MLLDGILGNIKKTESQFIFCLHIHFVYISYYFGQFRANSRIQMQKKQQQKKYMYMYINVLKYKNNNKFFVCK